MDEVRRLRWKKRAHRKSLIDQQKAILEKNARIKALETQLGFLSLPKAVEQPQQGYVGGPVKQVLC
jgi:hypothetical protein